MGVLPADVRNIMIELASDEAQRVATTKLAQMHDIRGGEVVHPIF
jgi:hypothetical protein